MDDRLDLAGTAEVRGMSSKLCSQCGSVAAALPLNGGTE